MQLLYVLTDIKAKDQHLNIKYIAQDEVISADIRKYQKVRKLFAVCICRTKK